MKVITINREYGAGGHSIGTKVAEKLGIEFYDKDIIKASALELGITPEELAGSEEKITTKEMIFRSISPTVSYDKKDAYFIAEGHAIIEIAKKGPCVILGRCADFILKEAGIEAINVFLYADEKDRYKRVGELIGSDNVAEIHKAIKRNDAARHSYYYNYTDKHWDELENYDLTINTGKFGFDKAINLICEAAKED